MNPNLSDWDEDLPPEPEEVYQDLLRALKRKSGFGLFFVQCTPGEADKFIVKLPQDIPQKKIAVLGFVEPIDNLYQRVAEFLKDKQVDILLIKGLEYSLYKYEQRNFGEITEGQFSNLSRVPPILNHLNKHRERFRDDFPISFVFLLWSFSINYLIHRAPDFFDWRSGVFELPTTPEVVEEESTRILDEADYKKYLKLSHEKKIEKVLEIQDLLREVETESRKASLLLELGRLFVTAKEYEAALASYDKAIEIKPDYHDAWSSRGNALWNLKRYEDALASHDEALEIKLDKHLAWFYGGAALILGLGRWIEGNASANKANEINPDFVKGQLKTLRRKIIITNVLQKLIAIFNRSYQGKIPVKITSADGDRYVTLRTVKAEAIVTLDGKLTVQLDGDITPGEYRVTLIIEEPGTQNIEQTSLENERSN